MRLLIAILISSFLIGMAWSIFAESSPQLVKLVPGDVVAESSGREKDYTSLKPSKQQDLQVSSSGQGISQTGVAKPEISSGPDTERFPN